MNSHYCEPRPASGVITGMPDVHVSLPARPITAVLPVVIRDEQTLLVQRANPAKRDRAGQAGSFAG